MTGPGAGENNNAARNMMLGGVQCSGEGRGGVRAGERGFGRGQSRAHGPSARPLVAVGLWLRG